MARAVASSSVMGDREELEQIKKWYKDKLYEPVEFPTFRYEPIRIGPTWQTEIINGKRHWLLPDRTIGWDGLAWCGKWLQVTRNVPWQFTMEQARWWLWWYAVNPSGVWLAKDGVLQRLKGWGKDPIGACLSMNELVGPCRVADWDASQPVGGDYGDAWVQIAAVSLVQTKNTMKLLPGMVTAACRAEYDVQVQKEQVHAVGNTRFMQAVTSSPTTMEGARSSFVLLNETHHWAANNDGHDMADVIERNVTKSTGGNARTLRITNAFEQGMDSQAERDRDAWEKAKERETPEKPNRTLYDSLEANPKAPLSADAAPEVINTIRGDSTWLDIDSIVESILDTRNPASRSRRFWYNQVLSAEDAWMTKELWDDIADENGHVEPDEQIVAFFDGSKSDDTTALVGCRISDGFVFRIASWSKPPKNRDSGWIVPREAVDVAVDTMFQEYDVKAFFADPSDVRDDEGERFWEPMIDSWHRRYGRQLDLWSVKSGDRLHSISWDMRSRERTAVFTEAAMRFCTEVEDRSFRHDGSKSLRQHVLNARRRPNEHGISLGKEHRESPKKIDLAVCAVGARMLRRMLLNKEPGGKKPRTGKVW